MSIYTVRELADSASHRRGFTVEVASLTAAKAAASRSPMFQGTVMVVEAESGARLAIKERGTWRDISAPSL